MKALKNIGLATFAAVAMTACVSEDDVAMPTFRPMIFAEDFEINAVDNSIIEIDGWENIAAEGTAKWKFQYYSSNNYAEFSSYATGEATNVGWLVSPAINLDETTNERLVFQVAQSYVTNASNKLEVLISTDYQPGMNVNTATWSALSANIPGTNATYFEFQPSGTIDLSSYEGNVHLAFKVTGSGTNTQLDGSYQIDNVRIYTAAN